MPSPPPPMLISVVRAPRDPLAPSAPTHLRSNSNRPCARSSSTSLLSPNTSHRVSWGSNRCQCWETRRARAMCWLRARRQIQEGVRESPAWCLSNDAHECQAGQVNGQREREYFHSQCMWTPKSSMGRQGMTSLFCSLLLSPRMGSASTRAS